jgi:Tol biopolymer transport system component
MTTSERFERDVPALLEDLYLGPTPPYRDDLLRRTAATSQRPGWTFIERWIPVSAITARFAAAPRIPWRAVGLAALLLIAFAAAAVYIGSRQHRVPPPFGPAANGQIPFIRSGNIYLGDPVTGETRLIVGDAGDDALPVFSPDGTKLAFIRDVPGSTTTPTDIYVADADGTNRRNLTPEGVWDRKWISWTPDSTRLIVIHTVNMVNQVDLYDVASGRVEQLEAAAGADIIQFRPPDGREMLYRMFDGQNKVLFAAAADGSNPRKLVQGLDFADNDLDLGGATYSADGSRIFYQRANPALAPNGCCRLWVMNADGSNPHEFVPPPSAAWDGVAVPSPDGRWIAYWHNLNDGPRHGVSVVRSDGTGPVIDTGPKLSNNVNFTWSPDSSKILMCCADSGGAVLLDPEGGPWTAVPWQSDADIDWQRTAR